MKEGPSKCRHPKSNAPTPTKQNQRPTSCRHPDSLANSSCSGFASGLEFVVRPHTNHASPKLRPEEPLNPKQHRNPPVMLNPETPKPGLLLSKMPHQAASVAEREPVPATNMRKSRCLVGPPHFRPATPCPALPYRSRTWHGAWFRPFGVRLRPRGFWCH